MKKSLLLLIIILLSFFLAFPASTQAVCYPKPPQAPKGPVISCGPGGSRCSPVSKNPTLCCTLPSECNQTSPSITTDPNITEAPTLQDSQSEDYKIRLCKSDTTGNCSACLNGGGIYTAFGCFSGDAGEFTGKILKFAVGIAGGVSFLMLVYGAFLYTISAGDPKALENAKGTISGAITGLLFIIFSAILLNMIGVQILQLPGF